MPFPSRFDKKPLLASLLVAPGVDRVLERRCRPPTVLNVITPSDNAVSVSESIILIIQFDQDLVKDSSGNINVKDYSDDSTFETTAMGSPSVYPPDKGFVPTTLSTLDYGTRDYIFSDNTSATFTVNAYCNDNTAVTENQTLILSVDRNTHPQHIRQYRKRRRR